MSPLHPATPCPVGVCSWNLWLETIRLWSVRWAPSGCSGPMAFPPPLLSSVTMGLWGPWRPGPRKWKAVVPSAVFSPGSPCPISSPLQPPASQPITVALTVAFPGKLDLQASCLTTLLMVWQRGTEHPGPPYEGPSRTSLCHSLRFYDAPLSSLHRSLAGRNWDAHLTVSPLRLFLVPLLPIIPPGPKT